MFEPKRRQVFCKMLAVIPLKPSFDALTSFVSIPQKLQDKYLKLKERFPSIATELAKMYSYIQDIVKSNQLSLNEMDVFFIATLTAGRDLFSQTGNFKEEAATQLKAIFNGYMSPFGNHFINIFSKNQLSIDSVSVAHLKEYQIQKEKLTPFRAVMVFESVQKVVIGNLKNLLPRVEIKSGIDTLLQLRKDIVVWAKEKGFNQSRLEELVSGDYVALAWRALPNLGPDSYKGIFAYAKFLSLLFFHDDDGDNLKALKKSEGVLLKVTQRNGVLIDIFHGNLDSHKENPDPVIQTAIEIMKEVHAIQATTKVNVPFLSREMENYFTKSSKESKHIKDQTIITEGYYLEKLRPYTSSLYACFALSAILQKIDVPDEQIAESTPGGELMKNGNMHVGIANDVVSYPKEITQEAISLVLLKLLQKAKHASLIAPDKCFLTEQDLKDINLKQPDILKQAVEDVILTLNTYMEAYEQGMSKIPHELEAFEEHCIRPWLPANGDWQDRSERYRQKLKLEGPIQECISQLRALGYDVIDISK